MKLTQKSRLKRRIQAYKNLGNNWTYLLESDFKGIFSSIAIKKGIDIGSCLGNFIDKVIDACNEEECRELNMKLDCYQIDKGSQK